MKKKPHIYLIGGWGSDASAWRPVVDRLTRESLACEVVDWQRALREPEELDCRLEEPAILAGWSLGGMLALQIALRCPDRVAGLALIATTARMTKDEGYPGVDSRAIRGMKLKLRSGRQDVLRDFSQLCFTDATTGQTLDSQSAEAYCQQSESCESDALTAGLTYLLKTDLRDPLGEIACPCKILHARGDAVMPHAQAEYLATQIPHAEFESLDAGVHALPIVEPEKTVEVILSLCEGGAA